MVRVPGYEIRCNIIGDGQACVLVTDLEKV